MALVACGGGGNSTDTAVPGSVSAAGAPQPGELPPRLLLTYGVLIKPNPARDCHETIVGDRDLSESFPRGVGADSIVLSTGAPDGAGGVARRMYVY